MFINIETAQNAKQWTIHVSSRGWSFLREELLRRLFCFAKLKLYMCLICNLVHHKVHVKAEDIGFQAQLTLQNWHWWVFRSQICRSLDSVYLTKPICAAHTLANMSLIYQRQYRPYKIWLYSTAAGQVVQGCRSKVYVKSQHLHMTLQSQSCHFHNHA